MKRSSVRKNVRKSFRKSVRLQTPNSKSSELNSYTTPRLATKSKAEKPPQNRLINQMEHQHVWKDSEIKTLIAAVEERPLLWADEFRNISKLTRAQQWKEVLMKIKIEGLDLEQVKKKWSYLRKNLKKLSRTQKGSSKWEKYMLFLSIIKSNPSSNKEVPNPSPRIPEAEPFKRRSARATSTSIGTSSTAALDPNLNISQASSPRCIQADVSSSTPWVSTISKPDPNATFCDYLLAELCLLSDIESRHLRGVLMQVVYDFVDTLEAQPTAHSNFY